MEQPAEGLPPQNPAEVPPVAPAVTPAPLEPAPPQGEEPVQISKRELDELRRRADVSSQNFERLRKEQERSAELEAQIAALQERPDPFGNNDEAIGKLQRELSEIKEKQQRSEVLEMYPQLKEVWDDFESYRTDESNRGMPLKTAAKAFMTEKGLLDPPRQGLERPTGGDRTPPQSGMTNEEVKKLRETDYPRYRELVKKGIIQV